MEVSPETPTSGEASWVNRPVFATGLMKSGSTLLLALLDGHPEMLVYPEEPSFDRIFLRHYRDKNQLVRDWLFGTPNPLHYAGQIRDRHAASGYDFRSWEPLPDAVRTDDLDLDLLRSKIQLYGVKDPSKVRFDVIRYHNELAERLRAGAVQSPRDVMVATALSARAASDLQGEPRCWFFKHPQPRYREASFEWFFKNFPDGRAIVLLRDPRGFMNSLLQYTYDDPQYARPRWRREAFFVRRLHYLEQDYIRFRNVGTRFGNERVIVLHYEDMIARLEDTMRLLARFLGVSFHGSMLVPMKAGAPAAVRTGTEKDAAQVYTRAVAKWRKELGPARTALVEAALNDYFAEFPEPHVPLLPRSLRSAARVPLRGVLRALDLALARFRPLPEPLPSNSGLTG
jgi:hypothetical protein